VDTEVWQMVDRKFRESQIVSAIQSLEAMLAKEPTTRFKGLLGAHFTNPPSFILAAINEFIRSCQERFDVKAAYLEMNGFDINYDRWYFDFFGYSEYGANPDNVEWLCYWQSENWPSVTLTGLEPIQRDFQWYDEMEIWRGQDYKKTTDLAHLLVMAKFVDLIETALQSGERAKPIPILATAHDFDIVGRFTSS
jgi:hypothetical protein